MILQTNLILIGSFILGLFHTPKEEQSSDILAHLSSRHYGHEHISSLKVRVWWWSSLQLRWDSKATLKIKTKILFQDSSTQSFMLLCTATTSWLPTSLNWKNRFGGKNILRNFNCSSSPCSWSTLQFHFSRIAAILKFHWLWD